MKYRTVLLFGPPGSGKGTQGKILGTIPRFKHFACGDVFRSLDRNSEMGRLFAQYSSTGGLVPDELTIELWRQRVESLIAAKEFNPQAQILLLDGIPRTVEQAILMDSYLDVMAVIYLFINSVEEIVARLRQRAIKENRPDDTDEEVIRHRIDVYDEQTAPVLARYPSNKIFRINATRELDQVTADILRALSFLLE